MLFNEIWTHKTAGRHQIHCFLWGCELSEDEMWARMRCVALSLFLLLFPFLSSFRFLADEFFLSEILALCLRWLLSSYIKNWQQRSFWEFDLMEYGRIALGGRPLSLLCLARSLRQLMGSNYVSDSIHLYMSRFSLSSLSSLPFPIVNW